MAKKRQIEVVLCDTTRIPSYEEYLEWCEINEVEPQSEDSDDFWEFVSTTQSEEWEVLMENIEYSEVEDYDWAVSGTLGLWCGRREVYPSIFKSLSEALYGCSGRSIKDIIVKRRGNVLEVDALHHDGTNRYELRALSPLGSERAERHEGCISLRNYENIQKLPEYIF